MDNNNSQRPKKKRVSRKVLRRRQLTALAIIAFLVLLFVILIAKGCSHSGSDGKGQESATTTTTGATVVTISPATETTTTVEVTTTVSPLAATVQLDKREIFLDGAGDTDVPYILAYPSGSGEENEVWKSMDDSIVTVDKLGHITAVAPGETYVVLSFNNNPGIEIEIKVVVADDGSAPAVTTSETTTTAVPAV